jgi:hypothetical protein
LGVTSSRECEAVRHLASQTVGRDQGHDSGSKRLAGHEVEAAAVDVGVAPTVYYQLVSCWGLRDAAEITVGHQPAIRLPAEQKAVPRREKE